MLCTNGHTARTRFLATIAALLSVGIAVPRAVAQPAGAIAAWGRNNDAQCNVADPNACYVAVDGGYGHTLALRRDGSMAAWGRNDWGQCDVPAPNSGFLDVAAGTFHSLGVRSAGSVVVWGSYDFRYFLPVPNASFVDVAAGMYHSLGRRSDGSIAAWGDNFYGQCS